MIPVEYSPKKRTINVMLLDGGVGDHICSLVAVDYLIKQYPWITPIVWIPDYLLEFAKHVLPQGTEVWRLSGMKGRYQPTRPTKTTQWDGVTSPMKIHLVDYAFLKLCDENPYVAHKNYLKVRTEEIDTASFSLPEKYVVVTTGYTAEVRSWPADQINKTVDGILERNLTPVFLGKTQADSGLAHKIEGKFNAKVQYDKGLNLIDKTTELQAAAIMSKSVAVMGVDNGLIHLAGCTDAHIIAGFTTVSPWIRFPIRNNELGWHCSAVTPYPELDCSFCQQTTNFLYGHDYRKCLNKPQSEKYLKCTTYMQSKDFLAHLDTILNLY